MTAGTRDALRAELNRRVSVAALNLAEAVMILAHDPEPVTGRAEAVAALRPLYSRLIGASALADLTATGRFRDDVVLGVIQAEARRHGDAPPPTVVLCTTMEG